MAKPALRPRYLAPGDKLGKFELIRQIAVGGMAELYLARTMGIEGFEKLVVVKRILPQYVDNPTFVNMFLDEARLSATLHHPNIVQVYDIGVEDGDYFFSMEYIHGEDLGHLAVTATENGVPLSLDAALTLIAGLCAGSALRAREGRPRRHAARRRASRRVALERAGQLRRRGQARRLRDRARRDRAVVDARRAQGEDRVHVARAVPRQGGARPAQRRLLGRHAALRADDRPAAVHRRDRVRGARPDRQRRRPAAERGRPRLPARARGDRDARARPRSRPAVPDRARAAGADRGLRAREPAPRSRRSCSSA